MFKPKHKTSKAALLKYLHLCLIIFLAALSLGAWWEIGKSKGNSTTQKKEVVQLPLDQNVQTAPTELKRETKVVPVQISEAKKVESVREEKSVELKKKDGKKSSALLESKPEKQKKSAGPKNENKVKSSVTPDLGSEKQGEEIKKIQNELRQVIHQTSQLQNKVRGNRVEVQEILERAKIHEKILRSIAAPAPVRTAQQIDVDEILRREKLRLLAEQTQHSQDQLRAIQQVRSSTSASKVAATAIKTSKIS